MKSIKEVLSMSKFIIFLVYCIVVFSLPINHRGPLLDHGIKKAHHALEENVPNKALRKGEVFEFKRCKAPRFYQLSISNIISFRS